MNPFSKGDLQKRHTQMKNKAGFRLVCPLNLGSGRVGGKRFGKSKEGPRFSGVPYCNAIPGKPKGGYLNDGRSREGSEILAINGVKGDVEAMRCELEERSQSGDRKMGVCCFLDCYWVGSLDFNFLGNRGVFH